MQAFFMQEIMSTIRYYSNTVVELFVTQKIGQFVGQSPGVV
jgi:hypothetical protein